MYKQNIMTGTSIRTNKSTYENSIEEQVRLMVNNGEPLEDGKNELIFTEKADGVLPAYNPRTDRFDIALETIEKMQRSEQAKGERIAKAKMKVVKDETTDVNNTNNQEENGG